MRRTSTVCESTHPFIIGIDSVSDRSNQLLNLRRIRYVVGESNAPTFHFPCLWVNFSLMSWVGHLCNDVHKGPRKPVRIVGFPGLCFLSEMNFVDHAGQVANKEWRSSKFIECELCKAFHT